MNIYIRLSIEYKMPTSEVRRCLTIKFTLFLMLAGVGLAQKSNVNTVTGPVNANGGGASELRKCAHTRPYAVWLGNLTQAKMVQSTRAV